MRHYTMPDADALRRIRPDGLKERRRLLAILGFLLIVAICAAGLAYVVQRDQQYRDKNWLTAVATVEDTRPLLASQINTGRGGAMLYKVQVLVKFSVNGAEQVKWITTEQPPRTLEYVTFQGRMWKGKKCLVRWDPKDPNLIVADLH